jgi:glycosyltransferase involved in cell wall biosynthesis
MRTTAAPVAVIMLSLNEAHNMEAVCENLAGWAQEVFLVDSYSKDETVDIALRHGVHVVQRRFRDFGDQWNFALRELPVSAPWTMKLDPDERLTPALKENLARAMAESDAVGFSLTRRICMLGAPLPVRQRIVRVWRSGRCQFSPVAVNEHPVVNGPVQHVLGELDHHDSPDLEHWLDKQNRYTTAEAVIAFKKLALADHARLFGTELQRRMWLKKHFNRLPFRYSLFFYYNYLWLGAWRGGRPGAIWARLRADVMRLRDYKRVEMELTGRIPGERVYGPGKPDDRVPQYE